MWSGTDGAALALGRVSEKVMWKWNVAELDVSQRLLQSWEIIFLETVKTSCHQGEFQCRPQYLNNWYMTLSCSLASIYLFVLFFPVCFLLLCITSTKTPKMQRETRPLHATMLDTQLPSNYRDASEIEGNASLSRQLTAWASSASDMQNKEKMALEEKIVPSAQRQNKQERQANTHTHGGK